MITEASGVSEQKEGAQDEKTRCRSGHHPREILGIRSKKIKPECGEVRQSPHAATWFLRRMVLPGRWICTTWNARNQSSEVRMRRKTEISSVKLSSPNLMQHQKPHMTFTRTV